MSISRIDQPEKHNHGYYVRLTRNGKTAAKFFPDKSSGGKRAALRAAKKYHAQLIEKAALESKPRRPRLSARNTSGKLGISRTQYKNESGVTEYWQAAWIDSDGTRRNRKYSINRYGEDRALRMAVKARREGLAAKEG